MCVVVGVSVLFLLTPLAFANRCPSADYCACSPDLAIIKCTNRQITNELLFNVNSQLPESTILLNLSSNALTSVEFLSNLNHLEILDLSFNKIHYLPADFLARFPHLTSLYLQNNRLQAIPKTFKTISHVTLDLANNPFHCTCQSRWYKGNRQLKNIICQNKKPFDSKDFCRTKSSLIISPAQSTIAYENEPFTLNCSSNANRYWTLNNKIYPSTITSSSYSTVIIDHLQIKHSGVWTCHHSNSNRSTSLTVLQTSAQQFCPAIRMNTSKGFFQWPRTLINNKIEKKCPFGSAAWLRNSNDYARAWYTCSSNGNWMNLDLSQCAFQSNISRTFDRLALTEANLLSRLTKYLSKLDQKYLELYDVILLIDLIDEQQTKYRNQERIMLVFHLTDFILQVKHDFVRSPEYRLAITRLRSIIERLLDFTDQPWLYIGKELTAMTMQAPFVSTLCLVPNRSLLTILCEPDSQHYESPLATIHFPARSNTTIHNSLYQIVFYRRSTLFVANDKQSNRNNPVIYLRPVSRYSSSPVGLTLYGAVNHASVGIWYSNQSAWQLKASVCKINTQTISFISTHCVLFNNNSLALTYLHDPNNHRHLFLGTKYSQLTVYTSSTLASFCFFISVFCYISFYKVYQMPRRFFHCVINHWLNVAILISLFAFGIEQTRYPLLCESISLGLHFLCLTTILWLTLLTFLIWSKYRLMPAKHHQHRKPPVIMVDYDEVTLPMVKLRPKSVVQLYLIVYGVAFLICAVNVVVSRDRHSRNNICFSKHFDSFLLLIIPIFIFVFVSLVFLLLARRYIKHLTNKRTTVQSFSDQLRTHPEDKLPSKGNKILPTVAPSGRTNKQVSSNLNHYHSYSDDSYSSESDYQYESINQLLSILCQFVLLILLFLSGSTIYLQPLHSFHLRFENIIYSHLYGFFVLFLAFYILSFHVLSRWNLIRRYYFRRNKDDRLVNRLYLEPPPSSRNSATTKDSDPPSCTEQASLLPTAHTCYLSNRDVCQLSQPNERATVYNEHIYDCKPVVKVTAEQYTLHRQISKSNPTTSREHVPFLPRFDVVTQRNTKRYRPQRNSLYERSLRRSTYAPIESQTTQNRNSYLSSSSFPSSQSVTCPRISPCQAIIRPIPIARLSTQNTVNSLSNSMNMIRSNDVRDSLTEENHPATSNRRSLHFLPASSQGGHQCVCVFSNQLDYSVHLDSSDEKSSSQKTSPYECIQVEYIDETEDGSVSLKPSLSDCKSSLDSISAKKDSSQALLSSSSLDSEMMFFTSITYKYMRALCE